MFKGIFNKKNFAHHLEKLSYSDTFNRKKSKLVQTHSRENIFWREVE
jgi:hypothetical protein